MGKSKLKRLSMEIEPEMHLLIKASATARGLSVRKWVLRAIAEQVKKEKSYK